MGYNYRVTPRSYLFSHDFASETDDANIFTVMRNKAEMLLQKSVAITVQYEKVSCFAPQAACMNPIWPNELTEFHNHNYYELNYVYTGKVYQYIGNKCFVMQPGHLLLLHPSVFHSPYTPHGARAENILINSHFFEQIASEYTKDNLLTRLVKKRGFLILDTSANAEITSQFEKILQYSNRVFSADSPSIPYFEARIRLLLTQLIVDETDSNQVETVQGFTNRQEEKSKQIIQYATTNFPTVTMDELCKRFGYSRMQIYRIFKNYAGYSFSNYIGDLRFNRIRYLLTRTDMSIDEICENVGLEKPYIFEFFKIRTGTTMLEYRKQLKGENSAILRM